MAVSLIFSSLSAKEHLHVPASEQRKIPHMIHMVAGALRVASTTRRTTPQGHSARATPEHLLATNVPPKTKPFPSDQAVRAHGDLACATPEHLPT
jgi:hypothetical protein